jgi:predicted lipoprotein
VKRRTLLACIPFGTLAIMDIAQAAPKKVGSVPTFDLFAGTSASTGPFLSARQRVLALLEDHYTPVAEALQQSATALRASLANPLTTWQAQQPLWVQTMLNWERLAAVAVGPLLERRAARSIDFWPTRPAQIQRQLDANAATPLTQEQIESVGSAARGLPALEWMFWRLPATPAHQHYARLLAQHVLNECTILMDSYRAMAAAPRSEEEASALYGEWYGQAVGGLDQLRIKKMVPDTRGKEVSLWVRGVSGQTTAAWQAQLQGVQAFLVGSPTAQAARPDWPVAGSLQGLLLGNDTAQPSRQLQHLTLATLRSGARARPDNAASLNAARQALAQLSQFLGGLADTVLQISMGFTDADGD